MIKEQQEQPKLHIKSTKSNVRFQLRLSDEIKHHYDPKTKMLDFELRAQYIKSATLYQKFLDKPLQWYKVTFAFIAGIKTKHEFVVFELQSGLYGSVDFYQQNRVLVRLGNLQTIIQSNESGKRKDSIAVSKNEVPYVIDMKYAEGNVTLGDLFKIIYQITPPTGYSQIKHNGYHFSRNLMKQLKKQKKGKNSIIRFKLVETNVGFQLV